MDDGPIVVRWIRVRSKYHPAPRTARHCHMTPRSPSQMPLRSGTPLSRRPARDHRRPCSRTANPHLESETSASSAAACPSLCVSALSLVLRRRSDTRMGLAAAASRRVAPARIMRPSMSHSIQRPPRQIVQSPPLALRILLSRCIVFKGREKGAHTAHPDLPCAHTRHATQHPTNATRHATAAPPTQTPPRSLTWPSKPSPSLPPSPGLGSRGWAPCRCSPYPVSRSTGG